MAQKGSLKPIMTFSGSSTRELHMVPDSRAAKAKEKVAKDPEEDASSRRGKADQVLPVIRRMPGKQKDNGLTVNGKIPHGTTGHGTQPRAKERKIRRAKEEASLEWMERTVSPAPSMEQLNLPMPRAVLEKLTKRQMSIYLWGVLKSIHPVVQNAWLRRLRHLPDSIWSSCALGRLALQSLTPLEASG